MDYGYLFAIAPALSVLLLHYRNTKLLRSKFKWYLLSILFVVSLSLLLFLDYDVYNSELKHVFAAWLSPLLVALIELFYTKESIKKHNRDFYLYIRNSDDIREGKDFQRSDKFFSITLMLFSFVLPLLLWLFLG